jgi:hypothetical protein
MDSLLGEGAEQKEEISSIIARRNLKKKKKEAWRYAENKKERYGDIDRVREVVEVKLAD